MGIHECSLSLEYCAVSMRVFSSVKTDEYYVQCAGTWRWLSAAAGAGAAAIAAAKVSPVQSTHTHTHTRARTHAQAHLQIAHFFSQGEGGRGRSVEHFEVPVCVSHGPTTITTTI